MSTQYGVEELPAQVATTTVIAAAASQRVALDSRCVRISTGAQGVWYIFGNSSVSATAGTAAEGFVPANWTLEVMAPATATHVAIIQNAATAVGSVQTF